MSTELKTIKCRQNYNVTLTSFYGGVKDGTCLQITKDNDGDTYIQLTKAQAKELVLEINKWLIGDYSSSKDFTD